MAGGAKDFLDHVDKDKSFRKKIRDGAWSHVQKLAEQAGHKFTKKELSAEVRKRYGVKKTIDGDDTDTCHFL
jgi:hypothetical protein